MGREFLLGAVLGEWGANDHDNIFYLGGWVASGVIVVGDLRDIAATISRGDLVGTGLNLAALIPGYGDTAKVAAVVGKFVLKHPELLKPAMVLLVGVAPHMDEAREILNRLRQTHGDVIDRLLRNEITEDELTVVASKNGNLLRTLVVIERADGKVIWPEGGRVNGQGRSNPLCWQARLETNPRGGRPVREVKGEVNDVDRERIIDQLRRCLAGREDVLLGYLYGSFLRHSGFHDIDIGLLVSGEREPYELYQYTMGIASDLERCITPRYEIDLRILNDAPVEFQYEVVKTGHLLVTRDEDTRVTFEVGVIAKFLDLKDLYDGIDRALLARAEE